MAGRRFAPRIAMYSHDTFGLGHITRTLRIGRAVTSALPEATVLVLTGSPVAHRMTFPDRIEYVKLPSVRKRGPEQYVSRDLSIPFWRLRQMRIRILRDTMRLYRPHLLFVDNVPLGMKGEILPCLEELKRAGTALHLNLRDILDEPGVVREQWQRDGTYSVLESLYDEIQVFGDASIHDSALAYSLPAEKTRFHGYIAPLERRQGERRPSRRRRNGCPSVLVTIGGGEDGAENIRCVLEAARALGDAHPISFDLVLGPLMECGESVAILEAIRRTPRVSGREFVADLADFMPQYDLVISMGGYNTLCEVMARARRSLVIPRVYPRREQELRARALAARGVLTMLQPSERTPERLGAMIRESLEEGPVLPSPWTPSMEGLASLQRRLVEMAPSFQDPPPRVRSRKREERASIRARAPVGSGVLALALGLLLGVAGPAGAGVLPRDVNTEVMAGYDSNILDASDAEIRAFETHDPNSYFVVGRMRDAAMTAGLDGKWALPISGEKTDLRLRYERLQYLHEPIRVENHYSLLWRSQIDPGTSVAFTLALAPDVYQRHRKDKDAVPGDPVFRAEVRDEWDTSIQIVRALAPAWSSQFVLEGSLRDYTEAFNERDRWRAGGRAGLIWQPGGVKLDLSGGYRRLRSRNVPYLGSDLSYRDWSLRSSLEGTCLGGFLKLRGYANHDWLMYTSSDPSDANHFGRQDQEWDLGGVAQHSLSRSLDWKISVAHVQRSASSALSSTSDLDEEGSIRDTFVATGFAWHWHP